MKLILHQPDQHQPEVSKTSRPRKELVMSNLIPHRNGHLTRSAEALNAQLAEAERPGLEAVASIQAAAFASSVAMQNACMLSRQADCAFRVSPMGEDLYRSILMAYGSVAVVEIQTLGLRGR
jgi:hypothetical protein